MLTKAIIEQVISQYEVRVRIPLYNKAADAINCTPKEQLCIASTCIPAGQSYNYNVGDIVYVSFEDNDISKPVVLGFLYSANKPITTSDILARDLSVDGEAILSKYTSIGNVAGNEIETLKGQKTNISGEFEISGGGNSDHLVGITEFNIANFDTEKHEHLNWNYHIYDDNAVVLWKTWRKTDIALTVSKNGAYVSTQYTDDLPITLDNGAVVISHVSQALWISDNWVENNILKYSFAANKEIASITADVRMIIIGKRGK